MQIFNYRQRVQAVADEIGRRRLDAFFVTNAVNISYLTGFTGHDSMLIIMPRKRIFLTDSRYIEEANDTLKGFEIRLVGGSVYESLKDIAKEYSVRKIGFESMRLSYGAADRLKTLVKDIQFVPMRDLVEDVRVIKEDGEITLIKRSIMVAKKTLKKASKALRPGMTERALRDAIEIEFIKNGARPGFDPIVASGRNSSKPHARPTNDRIRKNSLVMIDIGCSLDGYNSDITRTIFLGKVPRRIKEICRIVMEAQKIALKKVRPDARASEIDFAARGFIHKNGYGKYFGHALGHGVGLEVHEAPSISKISPDILRPGMVFTIEPAIYIPDLGGVRFEDMVLVTKSGYKILTS